MRMVVSQDAHSLVSIIIPVADYHAGIANRAIAAARSQTIPANVIVVDDVEKRGAGYARNVGVSRSDALFVVFLDADDTLAPDFVQETLSLYTPGHYVYCDDWQGESLHQTPDCGVYQTGTWHVVTTLLPRQLFQHVGGFDESLPALEDLDLYLRLQAAGVCGVRCPKPLLWYNGEGKRSKAQRERDPRSTLRDSIYAKHIGRVRMGSCAKCGGGNGNGAIPANQPPPDHANEPGFLLAEALYSKRQEFGPATHILYAAPRGYNDYRLWVHRDDILAAPDRWKVVSNFDPKTESPSIADIQRMVMGTVQS